MKPVSFYLLTDTHYFENELGAEGKEFEEYMHKKYETIFEMKGNIPVEKFKDEKIQKLFFGLSCYRDFCFES